MVQALLHALRYAVRALRRTPGFALAAIVILALGIGATTTIFTVVNGVVLMDVVARGMRLVGPSILLGLGGSLLLTRFPGGGLLYETSPHDPLTLGGIAVLLTAVALAACYLPARRATAVDPAIALRSE